MIDLAIRESALVASLRTLSVITSAIAVALE